MPENLLGNIIAYYSLLVTILIPVVILLLESIKESPGIDRQILLKKLLPTKRLGILLSVFIFPVILALMFCNEYLGNKLIIYYLIILTVLMTISVFYSIAKMICWIFSGESKDAFHGYYRQNIRIDFLNKGQTKDIDEKWFQFWADEKTINYFNNDICPYIDAYFSKLKALDGEEWETVKKSSLTFAYKIDEIYASSKKAVRIYAYDDRAYTKELLMKTIPFCLMNNIENNVSNLKDDDKNSFLVWYSYILNEIMEKARADKDSVSIEWINAFNIFFFGTEKAERGALMVLLLINSIFYNKNKTKKEIKKEIDICIKMSNKRYSAFYKQLYADLGKSLDKTKILKMMEKGCSTK